MNTNKFEAPKNSRQDELHKFAASNDYVFHPLIILNVSKFKDFPIDKGTHVLYQENVMSAYTECGKMEISDIALAENDGQEREDVHITALHFPDLDLGIPDFSLEPEHLRTRHSVLPVCHAIDFDNHPHFSKKYFLYGEDTRAVRSMFDEHIIGFLETHQPIHIECHQNKLLFYLRRELLNPEEIRFMVSLANNFLAILQPLPTALN